MSVYQHVLSAQLVRVCEYRAYHIFFPIYSTVLLTPVIVIEVPVYKHLSK